MANVFGILTAIVLALAAFVATKNKAHYDEEITAANTQKQILAKSQARLKHDKDELAQLPVTRGEVDADVAKLGEEEGALIKANDKAKAQNDAKSAKVATNKAQLDAIREKTASVGNLTELASKMNATNTELERLSQAITAAEAKLANTTAQNSQAETQVKSSKDKFDNFSKGQSLPALKTRVRSIYPNWGFVTLAAGNNAGVVANSTLDVVRDGQTIAKLLVTAVEANTSSASIVPDSLSKDVTLMVGDQVIPGQKSAVKSAPAASN